MKVGDGYQPKIEVEKMPVLKIIKNKDFVTMTNILAQNPDLSYEAKGLLLELLSRPNDWKLVKSQLIRTHTGYTKITRILGELQKAKHLHIISERDKQTGQYIDRIWFVCENPIEPTDITTYNQETLGTENPTVGEPQHTKTELIHNIESIQEIEKENVPSPAGLADVSTPKPYTSKVYDKESLPYQLAEALITKVSQRRGTYNHYLKTDVGREKLLQNNAYSFDLLLRKDKKDINEVLEVLTWSQEDDFWKNNILSAEKFRLQYGRLLSQMRAKGIGSLAPDPNADFTKKLIDVYRMLIRNDKYIPSPLQHLKFIQASQMAVDFFTAKGLENQDPWADYILRCLGKNYIEKGETIYPGHFCSEQTWQILMPQYLAEVGLV